MTAEEQMRRATVCASCGESGRVGGATCLDCGGAGWLDHDGEPCEPMIDGLIAAAVMPVPALEDDPAWKLIQAAQAEESRS